MSRRKVSIADKKLHRIGSYLILHKVLGQEHTSTHPCGRTFERAQQFSAQDLWA